MKDSRPPRFTRRLPSPHVAIACCLALLVGSASARHDYPFKLNGTLVAGGTVSGYFTISPDGARVVYRADQDSDGVYELYSVPATGGTPVKLNGTLVAGGKVEIGFAISPDGARVVYRADQDTDGVIELYSVAISGGKPLKLNGTLVAGGDVRDFSISPDGSRVVYRAIQDSDNVYELYSVPIAGGTTIKLNGALVVNGNVLDDFSISPDGSRVVYRADQDSDEFQELYSVPIAGGTPVKLNGTLVVYGDVFDFAISPDNTRVVYRADQDTNHVSELYSVPIAGGTQVKLNGILAANGNVKPDFAISPNGARVVYRADQDTAYVSELYSVPTSGGTSVKLNGTLAANGNVFDEFFISPDGTCVVYRADQDTDNVSELYSVPTAGGIPVKLNGTLVAGGDVRGFAISPDDARVVYRADQDTDGVTELYSMPVTGGTPVKLNGTLVGGGNVLSFAISPDGARVVYRAVQYTDNVSELYSVPVAGGTPVKLNGTLVANGNVWDFAISPDGTYVVYRADQDNVYELYVGRAQAHWQSAGGSWADGTNWENSILPEGTLHAVIARPALVSLSAGTTPTEARSLYLGATGGQAILELRDGAVLNLPMGAELDLGGVLRGDGALFLGNTSLNLPAGARLRADEGDRLHVQSVAVSNAGSIEASGTIPLPAEIEFSGSVTNLSDTGLISGHEATLFFDEELLNRGALVFSGGVNEVRGDVTNYPTGIIVVSGGAAAIFYEDVSNSGTINVSASGSLQSAAVFFGAFSGNGISGGGHVFLEGDVRPGFSAGTMSFGGDVSYGPLALFDVEIAGPAPGNEYDQLTVSSHLELGGSLNVSFIDGFVPAAGMVFDLWDAGSVSGQFLAVILPALPSGLFWHSGDIDLTGELRVGLTPETYGEFAAHYNLIGGPDGNDDDDSLGNIIEYLAGRNPTLPEASGFLSDFSRNADENQFSFFIADPAGSDLITRIEVSTTLEAGTWSMIATRHGNDPWTGPTLPSVSTVGPGLSRVTLTHTMPGAPKLFYRVSAEIAP